MIMDSEPIDNQSTYVYVNNEIYKEMSSTNLLSAMNEQQRRQERYKKQRLEAEKRRKQREEAERARIKDPFGNGLKIHENEMAIIYRIINYMDSKSTLALGWPSNQRFLIDEGAKIDHVHPLCFIWTVLKDPNLKRKLKAFRDDSAFALKWNGFLGYSPFHDKGFGRNMEKYYNHRHTNDVMHEFNAFYKTLNLKPEAMNNFVKRKDWKGFASALLDSSSYR